MLPETLAGMEGGQRAGPQPQSTHPAPNGTIQTLSFGVELLFTWGLASLVFW